MKTKCPQCNYIATEHETLINEQTPVDGDISFCIECGEFNEFKNKNLVKVDLVNIDLETKKEMTKIRDAWIRTQALARLKK